MPGFDLEDGERLEVDWGVSPEPVDPESLYRGSSRKRPGRESKYVSVGSFARSDVGSTGVIIHA